MARMYGTLQLAWWPLPLFLSGSRALSAFTFQVSAMAPNLLGFDLSGFFHLRQHGCHHSNGIHALAATLAAALYWVGLPFHLQPRAVIDPAVPLVIQPLRWLPLALQDDLIAKRQKLLDAGIIERADASPWVSNLAVARKKRRWPPDLCGFQAGN